LFIERIYIILQNIEGVYFIVKIYININKIYKMIEQQKIKDALKTRYSSLGLSEEALNGAASILSITITDESQIEAVVNGAESSLKGFQAEVDRRVTTISGENQRLEAENLGLKKATPPTTPPVTPPVAGTVDDKTLEMLTKMQETIQGLTDKQNRDTVLKTNSELIASAKAGMIAKGIESSSCDKILGTINIAEGETVDTLSAKGIAGYNDFKQMFTPEGVSPFKNKAPDGEDQVSSFFKVKATEKENNLKQN